VRLIGIFAGVILLLALSAISFAQDLSPNLNPGYARMPNVNINSVKIPSSTIRIVLPKGATSTRGIVANDANANSSGGPNSASRRRGSGNSGPNIRGLDTVPTFTGAFASPAPSIDPFLNNFGFTANVSPFIMIGNNPALGGTTTIPAKITTVSLQLLNPDNSVFTTVPFAPFEDLTEDSPNFRSANYSVGRTQFGDAVQRAEFFNMMQPDWHTLLNPEIVNRVTIPVPKFVEVEFSDGTTEVVPGYITRVIKGNRVVFMLDALFSILDFNQAVNDIVGGQFTTDAMNFHVYPNTFLFSVVEGQQGFPCCVLGFHEFIFDPTVTPEPRWIYSFASWISPGIFGGGFQDVTGLSHEISEALNDPFGNNIVPTWQFPGIPGACQANLETGDPVEVLKTATVPIVTREGNEVFQYHPQTEALLQWFEIGSPSNAIGGAFSYPDTTALTTTATPCPQ
jgi:hypothetical protein